MNKIRVKSFQSSTNLTCLQDAINDDLKRERIGEIISVDAFTTGINNDTLVVVVSYTEDDLNRNKYKCIIDYYDESDDWFHASNYCVPPKCVATGPRKEAIVIVAFVTFH